MNFPIPEIPKILTPNFWGVGIVTIDFINGTFSSKNDLRGHFYQIWVFYIILTCNIRIIIGENIRPCLLNKKMRYGSPDTFLKPFAQ